MPEPIIPCFSGYIRGRVSGAVLHGGCQCRTVVDAECDRNWIKDGGG